LLEREHWASIFCGRFAFFPHVIPKKKCSWNGASRADKESAQRNELLTLSCYWRFWVIRAVLLSRRALQLSAQQLWVPHVPGFPVVLDGTNELHAAFFVESRIRDHG
jgi:hypothetical protein